jgi:hypothetical protein
VAQDKKVPEVWVEEEGEEVVVEREQGRQVAPAPMHIYRMLSPCWVREREQGDRAEVAGRGAAGGEREFSGGNTTVCEGLGGCRPWEEEEEEEEEQEEEEEEPWQTV